MEQSPTEQPSKATEIKNPWEGFGEGLKEKARNLVQKFLQDYPSNLPDAIIVPDVSARPLIYLLKPVLDKVAEKRGIPQPRFYFFASSRWRSEQIVKGRKYSEKTLSIYQTRANQIKEGLKKAGKEDPEIVIFDEDVTSEALTTQAIGKAFGQQLPMYALEGALSDDEFAQKGLPVKTGNEEGLAVGMLGAIVNYRYSAGVEKRKGPIVMSGVTTSSKPDTRTLYVRGIREQFKKIGEELAQEITNMGNLDNSAAKAA